MPLSCIGNISPGFKATERRNMLIIGAANSLDTYLSPLTYRGTELRFTSQTVHNRPGRNWTYSLTHGLRLARETMRTNDGVRLEGGYDFSCSWQRKIVNRTIGYWGRLMVTAGAGVDATVGFRYNAQNSNNPAQAEAAVCFTPAMAADWRFFLVSPKSGRRRALGLRYEAAVPLVGMMFSPLAKATMRYSHVETTTITCVRYGLATRPPCDSACFSTSNCSNATSLSVTRAIIGRQKSTTLNTIDTQMPPF